MLPADQATLHPPPLRIRLLVLDRAARRIVETQASAALGVGTELSSVSLKPLAGRLVIAGRPSTSCQAR